MQIITVEVGSTRIETQNSALARLVLEQAAGLQAQPLAAFATATLEYTALPPAIGQHWHGQGGVYAGLMRGENGVPDYHLIVPHAEHAEAEEITWGGAGQAEPGACSEYDGAANTAALLASEHDHPAAQWAAGLELDGHKDFYLPARRELRLCWTNVPELFASAWHWSSTQFSPDVAWIQAFGVGSQGGAHKDYELRARAVRRVLTTSTL